MGRTDLVFDYVSEVIRRTPRIEDGVALIKWCAY